MTVQLIPVTIFQLKLASIFTWRMWKVLMIYVVTIKMPVFPKINWSDYEQQVTYSDFFLSLVKIDHITSNKNDAIVSVNCVI